MYDQFTSAIYPRRQYTFTDSNAGWLDIEPTLGCHFHPWTNAPSTNIGVGVVISLIFKRRESPSGVINTVATDVLVLKHQAISTHSADYVFIIWASFTTKYIIYGEQFWKILFRFEKRNNLSIQGLK